MAIKISKLAPQNPWWRGEDWEKSDRDIRGIDVLLDRKMMDVSKGDVIIIRGIRRSGKTVFLKLMIKELIRSGVDRRNILYLSSDRYSRKEIMNIIEEMSIRRGKIFLLLDEVTSLRDWNLLIKELHETRDIWIMATGSDPVQIKEKVERLPGRGVEGNEYYFNPLSFREFVHVLRKKVDRVAVDLVKEALQDLDGIPKISFASQDPKIDDIYPFYESLERLFYIYLMTGGFPNVVRDYIREGKVSDLRYETIVRMILGSLSKEGRSEATGRDVLEQILIGMGGRTDYISIANNIGGNHATVKEYVDLLNGARVSYTFHCWDLSKRIHALKKQKKFVFQSPFISLALQRYLTGGKWDDTLEFIDKNIEALVENTVMSHIVWSEERPIMNEQHAFSGFYYNKKECDCVLLGKKGFQGFEIKYGKVERARYPFPVLYISKDTLSEDTIPASVFLYGLEIGSWSR